MNTLEELIRELQAVGALHTPDIIAAFRKVDRVNFVPAPYRNQAYENIPLPIGHGQTISQPYTVATMLELLQPQARDHCLDVGAGSGWGAALLAELVGPRGAVTAVERIPALVERAKTVVEQYGWPQLKIISADASRGYQAAAPYEVIHVAAAALVVPPELKAQLSVGGRLIIPVGDPVQDLAFIKKTGDNTFTEQRISGFQFVPLISA